MPKSEATVAAIPYEAVPRSNADVDAVTKQLANQQITDVGGNERDAAAMVSGSELM